MSSSNLHAPFGSEITVTTVSCAQYVNAFAVTLIRHIFTGFAHIRNMEYYGCMNLNALCTETCIRKFCGHVHV
jgi:hypothetical protein